MTDRSRKRRIAVVTGTRAEYGLLRSTIRSISEHPTLHLQLVVTGMHLLRGFGRTVRQVEEDGWEIAARVPMQRGDDSALDQARGLSRGVAGIAKFLDSAGSDVVLVLGDRIEAMAGALAATTTGRFLAHVHGGDVAAGQFDDALRHSITKLAHIHFAASRDAARRIIRMGEDAKQVHTVGAPGLDDLFAIMHEDPQKGQTSDALIVQHAYGRDPKVECRVMIAILRAVRTSGLKATVVYPNSDTGHSGVIEAIERARDHYGLNVVRSLPRDAYLRKLIHARVLVGNSSSGILEASAAGTPSVNVGSRQLGRLRGGRSVVDARETYADIRRALARALKTRPRKRTQAPYGDGNAGHWIARVLAGASMSADRLRKRNTF